MTNPDLAALSAAASTAKYWLESSYRGDLAKDQHEALETLVALEAAYRTGNLVQIDREGMREVLARAYSQGATDVHNCWINDGGQWDADFGEAASDYAHANADATIAAILGGENV